VAPAMAGQCCTISLLLPALWEIRQANLTWYDAIKHHGYAEMGLLSPWISVFTILQGPGMRRRWQPPGWRMTHRGCGRRCRTLAGCAALPRPIGAPLSPDISPESVLISRLLKYTESVIYYWYHVSMQHFVIDLLIFICYYVLKQKFDKDFPFLLEH
jgi:hypothetical protein